GSPFGPGATSPGLHVWRVEQLRPVQIPEATLGVLFSGDTYVVLHNGLEEQAHLHLWAETPRRTSGLPLHPTELAAGRAPCHPPRGSGQRVRPLHGLLPPRPHLPTYRSEGSMALASTCAQPGPGPMPKLYHMKGKRKIWASQWDSSWASFNTCDFFLLDLGQRGKGCLSPLSHSLLLPSLAPRLFSPVVGKTLVVGCGAWNNVLERSRMQELAAARTVSRAAKHTWRIVADSKEPPELVQHVLGPKPPLQEGSPEVDVVADQNNTGAAVLYKARTWQDAIMAPGLGMPKSHHAGHRRYMRLGTARVHHDGPQEHMRLDMALW
ncbi:hypothetical protein Nmel_018503, partial [Mimus melanotis]